MRARKKTNPVFSHSCCCSLPPQSLLGRDLGGWGAAGPPNAVCSALAARRGWLPSLRLSRVLSATKSWQQPCSCSRVGAIVILCYFPVNSPPFTLSFNFRLSALFPLLPKPRIPCQCPPRRSRAVGSCPWPHRRGTELCGCRWDPGRARKRLLNPGQGLCFCSTSVCFAGKNGTAQPAEQSGVSASARRKQTAVHFHSV